MVSNGFLNDLQKKTMITFIFCMIIITMILMKRVALLAIEILSTPYKIPQNEVDKNDGKN